MASADSDTTSLCQYSHVPDARDRSVITIYPCHLYIVLSDNVSLVSYYRIIIVSGLEWAAGIPGDSRRAGVS